MSPPADLDQRLRACVHCGLCLESCPTYVQLGTEPDSPRGRIVLLKGIREKRIEPTPAVRRHLDLCLDCRACETACPSNVAYGSLIESFRAKQAPPRRSGLAALTDHVLYRVLPDRRRLRRWLAFGRMARVAGLFKLLDATGRAGRRSPALHRMWRMLPARAAHAEALRQHYAPEGKPRARAALFIGCVGEAVFPDTNRATIGVLQANGCAVDCPPDQTCCGAIHLHGGRGEAGRELARRNIAAFADGIPVVANVAGCGAMLRQYGELLSDDPHWADRARQFSSRVCDISEFLAGLPLRPPHNAVALRVAYHDACHLRHAQKVHREPRQLLRAIVGLELFEPAEPDLCCGAAGTYNLTQPDMADRLARRKLDQLAAAGADIVAAGNAGCILHLAAAARDAGRPLKFVHPIELLARAYGLETGNQARPF